MFFFEFFFANSERSLNPKNSCLPILQNSLLLSLLDVRALYISFLRWSSLNTIGTEYCGIINKLFPRSIVGYT